MAKPPHTKANDSADCNAKAGERRDFDGIGKALIKSSSVIPWMFGRCRSFERLDIEFNEVQKQIADNLFRLDDDKGTILHIELQSFDDPTMGWRMLNYLRLIRTEQKLTGPVKQVVLHMGDTPYTDEWHRVIDEDLSYACQAVDFKHLSSEPFLESERIEDNILALLCSDGGSPKTLRRLKEQYDRLVGNEREDAYVKIGQVAGLRGRDLVDAVLKEVSMPMVPLRENPFFKDAIHEIEVEKEAKGKVEGKVEGKIEAVLEILSFRGFEVTDAVRAAIAETDAKTVERMLRSAMAAETIDEFSAEFDIPSGYTM